MSRVYLELEGNKWNEVAKSDFWIDKALLEKLKNLKKIQHKGWDGVLIIDGKERSGKSVLGMICGWYLSNKKLSVFNFARGIKDAAKKISQLPEGSVIIVDEASTIFSGKDHANKAQRKLIKILDVVGQKNLIFILCLPCFFDLNKTIAVRRSLFLLHVYPDSEYNRGSYAFWGEKNKGQLYKYGKKNFDSYAYPRSEFIGMYFDFKPPFYEQYLKEVKAEALREVLNDAIEGANVNDLIRLNNIKFAGRFIERYPKPNHAKLAEVFECDRKTLFNWTQEYKRLQKEGISLEKGKEHEKKSQIYYSSKLENKNQEDKPKIKVEVPLPP